VTDEVEARLADARAQHLRRVVSIVAALVAGFTLTAVPPVVAEGIPLGRAMPPLLATSAAAATAVVLAHRGGLRTAFALVAAAVLATIADAHSMPMIGRTAPVHGTELVILASAFLGWCPLVGFGAFVATAVLGIRFLRPDDPAWFDATLDLVAAPLLATALLSVERRRAEHDESVLREALRARALASEAADRAANEARLASRVKSEFLARVSHELRTPINAILGYTELVQESDDTLTAETRADLGRVQLASRNLLALVDDVLDLSRVEAGRVASTPERVTLDALVTPAIASTTPQLTRNRNRIVVETTPGEVEVDPRLVRQVLVNLLANAARFTTDGTVTLRSRVDEHSVRFDVIDTGIGIRAERIGALFQPFVQAEADTAYKYGGTGLGLAICDRLVRAMGGRIEVESALGVGSRFTVVLPLNAERSEPTAPLLSVEGPAPRQSLS
jgi:signal transduction histidine kinase